MKKLISFRLILSLLLAAIMLLGLSSCKSRNEDETTTQPEVITANADIPLTDEALTEASTQTPTASPTQQPQTTQAPVTETQTQQQEIITQPEITGTKTITDGNKTVVYPLSLESSERTYPVIAWANGTGCPTRLYIKLLEKLADGGYIVVADSSVMTADGTAQIDSINYIINKNSDSSSVFYNKVDTYAIGVSGQSQGGRSCINAAQKDSRIRCVVSIAGASSADEARGLATPCFFITGTNDNIVASSQWCQPSYNAVSGRAAYASVVGGTHLTFSTHTDLLASYALDWFNAYLKNDADAKNVFANGGKLSTDGAWQDFQNKN